MMIMLNLNIYKQISLTFAFFIFLSSLVSLHIYSFFFFLCCCCVCVCIDYKKKLILFFLAHFIYYSILYMCHTFSVSLLLLCSRVKKENIYQKTHSFHILKKKSAHTSLSLFCFFHLFFLYSNPCFSLSRALFFFTIFTDNTLKRSFVFKKQTEKNSKDSFFYL